MTTITTPVRIGPGLPRVALVILLVALVAAGVGLLAWSVIDARGGDQAPVDPATASVVESELPGALSRGTASVVESELPGALSRGTASVVESELPGALSRGTASVVDQ